MPSIFFPIIGFFGSVVRLTILARGDTNPNANITCYDWVSYLYRHANRWGFVYVGVRNLDFPQASDDTWSMFSRVEMIGLVNSDLTAAFCLLSAIAARSISSLVSGIWSLIVHSSYVMEVSVYAFLIGYFLCCLAMAWPQACVMAYYVTYADYPQSPQFAFTIAVRMEEIRRFDAVHMV